MARPYFYVDRPQADGSVLKEAVLSLVVPVGAIPAIIEALLWPSWGAWARGGGAAVI